MSSPLVISLAGLTALAVAMGIGRFAFTPILPLMLEEDLLSLGNGGMLASANYIGYLLGAIGAAFISIRPERAIPAGMLAIGLATIAMALNVPLSAWLLLRCIAGIASAWVLVSVSAWSLNALAEYERPFLNGLVFAGVGIGIAVTGLICLMLTAFHGTASIAWMGIGVLALLLAALTWRVFAEATAAALESHVNVPSTFRWNSYSVWMTIVYGIFGFGYIIPATFLPVMARNALPDPTLSAWTWPLFGTIGAISVLFTGKLVKRIGNLRLWAACHVILAVGVALPALFDGLLPVVLSAICVGGTFMMITLAAMQEAKAAAPGRSGTLIAGMTAAFATGQIIGPLTVPFFSRNSSDFTFILLASAVLMAGSAVILLRNPGRKHIYQNIRKE
jgi:MFS family permease